MRLALEINQVEQSFRTGFWLKRLKILKEVSFEVPEKSVFGFLGANGAGKTTLIHLIAGLRKPSAGKVTILGHEAHSTEAKGKIGYLPERPYFYEHLTGEGLLKYFGALSGWSTAKVNSRIPVVLSLVGMTAARKVELRRYSKGMLQRIGIAQAMIHDPEFLVLDEPMSGLDPLGRKEMRELISSLSHQGKTIFFSSHVIPDVEAICDRVALIEKGKILGYGPIGQFLDTASVGKEIAFTGFEIQDPKHWPEFQLLNKIPEGFKGMISNQDKTDQALAKLLERKAKILWVNPVRASLEDFFGRSQ